MEPNADLPALTKLSGLERSALLMLGLGAVGIRRFG